MANRNAPHTPAHALYHAARLTAAFAGLEAVGVEVDEAGIALVVLVGLLLARELAVGGDVRAGGGPVCGGHGGSGGWMSERWCISVI